MVIFNFYLLVVANMFHLVIVDGLGAVVEHFDILIFLRMEVNFFFVILVIKIQLIVPLPPVGLGLDHHPGHVLGELVRRQVIGIVGPPGDNRLVNVPIVMIGMFFKRR